MEAVAPFAAQFGGVVLEGILESQPRVIFCRTLASIPHLIVVVIICQSHLLP